MLVWAGVHQQWQSNIRSIFSTSTTSLSKNIHVDERCVCLWRKKRCKKTRRKEEEKEKYLARYLTLASIRVCFILKKNAVAMSTSLTNYSTHMEQQQQQQSTRQTHSNLVKSPHLILTQSNSTSTVILGEEIRGEQTHLQPPLLLNRSVSLRSLLKTSGLFNKGDWLSSIEEEKYHWMIFFE